MSRVRLVSPARAAALEKLGVRTLRDLLTHFPRSYIDLSQVERRLTPRTQAIIINSPNNPSGVVYTR